MSVEALGIALNHSKAKGSAKLVLIGIANHAGDGGAWPSVATLARYAGITDRRRIQRCIAQLEELGEIRRHVQAGGNDDMASSQRPNLYRFTLTCPPDCDRTASHKRRSELPVVFDDPAVVGPPHPQMGAVNRPQGGRSVDRAPRGRTTAQTVLEPRDSKSVLNPRGQGGCFSGKPHRYGTPRSGLDAECLDCGSIRESRSA